MDISMPEMDGIEATRRIHAELPFIQIFGLSAHEFTANLQAIQQAGGSDYFLKGSDMDRLIDRLLSVRIEKAQGRTKAKTK
jgi:DNA-binding NarL/FixJ family response regulator